jgi:glycosyltransferase involved in cell wall biosynthesis
MTAMEGLRILITTDAVGGVWVFSSLLARALARRGAEVSLVTLGPAPKAEQLTPLRSEPSIELVVTDFALEWMDPERRDIDRTRTGLARIARRQRPDLVHINGYREALVDWRLPVLLTAHSCVRSWWLACRGHEPPQEQWDGYIADVAAGLAAVDLWAAPSAAFRDTMQTLYSPAHAGKVIHNGADATHGIARKQPLIVAAGRLWDEAKNVKAIVAAAGRLDWPIQLAGAPPEHAGGVANLRFLGELPRYDLLALMAGAGIFVAPALYEPFGLGVLEAAMSGCALVLSDIPSFRELWTGAALFVDPRDALALVSALQRLCKDTELRKQLAHAAARRARRYSVTAMIDAYCGAYCTLLSSPLVNPLGSAPVLQESRA